MDDILCGTIAYSSSKTFYEIQCGRPGKTVKITQDKNVPMTLCEVEAFGNPVSALKFTTATQGSTSWDGVASRAIDGNIDGVYDHK